MFGTRRSLDEFQSRSRRCPPKETHRFGVVIQIAVWYYKARVWVQLVLGLGGLKFEYLVWVRV